MLSYDSRKLTAIKDWLGTGSINIFGLPFAGKDTHGSELAELFNGVMLSGGDILRNSVIPDHVKSIMEAGGLEPTDEYVAIVLPYLSKAEFKDRPLILSSVGRWHGEEIGVLEASEESGHPMKAVVYLEVDADIIWQRWRASQEKGDRSGRADDAEHLMEVRFEEFRAKTLPVIEEYRARDLLVQIDGVPPVQHVSTAILDALYARASA